MDSPLNNNHTQLKIKKKSCTGTNVKHKGSFLFLTACREDVKDKDEEADAPHADNDNPVAALPDVTRQDSQIRGSLTSSHFLELRVRARLF